MTEQNPQLDANLVAQQAEAIAASQIEKLKEGLADTLLGRSSNNTPPASWGALDEKNESMMDRKAKEAVAEAEQRFEARMEAHRKAAEDSEKSAIASQQAQLNKEHNQILSEWRDAVADGLMPAVNPAIQKQIDSGTQFSNLTPEEQNDPGLQAWLQVYPVHQQLSTQGKSSSFRRTVEKFANPEPAGMSAPVFGNSIATPSSTPELTYAETRANTKKMFGF